MAPILEDLGGLPEIMKTTPTGMLTNPVVLAGAAGTMAQLTRQQTMEEITHYLATIDEKVDDVLRAQKDAAVLGSLASASSTRRP